MSRYIALAACLALAACAGAPKAEPKVEIVRVGVAVAASCVPDDFPAAPAYPDTDAALLAAPGPEARYGLMAAGRITKLRRLSELDAIISACRK